MLSPALRAKIPRSEQQARRAQDTKPKLLQRSDGREACLPFAAPSLGGPITFCHRLQPTDLAKGSQGRGGGGCWHGIPRFRGVVTVVAVTGFCVMPQAWVPEALVAFFGSSRRSWTCLPKPILKQVPNLSTTPALDHKARGCCIFPQTSTTRPTLTRMRLAHASPSAPSRPHACLVGRRRLGPPARDVRWT